jgi:large subunit ribosomal protein L24e
MQTTIKAMKRVAEIKQKREHAFWKHRMSVAREKHKDARRRAKAKLYERETARDAAIVASYADEAREEVSMEDTLELVQPIATSSKEKVVIKEKILVKSARKAQRQSALVTGEGRSMGMELD